MDTDGERPAPIFFTADGEGPFPVNIADRFGDVGEKTVERIPIIWRAEPVKEPNTELRCPEGLRPWQRGLGLELARGSEDARESVHERGFEVTIKVALTRVEQALAAFTLIEVVVGWADVGDGGLPLAPFFEGPGPGLSVAKPRAKVRK